MAHTKFPRSLERSAFFWSTPRWRLDEKWLKPGISLFLENVGGTFPWQHLVISSGSPTPSTVTPAQEQIYLPITGSLRLRCWGPRRCPAASHSRTRKNLPGPWALHPGFPAFHPPGGGRIALPWYPLLGRGQPEPLVAVARPRPRTPAL